MRAPVGFTLLPSDFSFLALPFFCLLACMTSLSHAQSMDHFGNFDPSGVWRNDNGGLSLMLAGDALSFSYASTFGASAHLCSGAGVAGLVTSNVYHYVDEEGTIAFEVDADTVRMRPVDGVLSFCGAGWTGETYTRQGFSLPRRCTVTARRSRFLVVMPSPPTERRGYVVEGNTVEIVTAQHEDATSLLLARYRGKRSTTVGLLRARTLSCPD